MCGASLDAGHDVANLNGCALSGEDVDDTAVRRRYLHGRLVRLQLQKWVIGLNRFAVGFDPANDDSFTHRFPERRNLETFDEAMRIVLTPKQKNNQIQSGGGG
jgi:hypothetical protein